MKIRFKFSEYACAQAFLFYIRTCFCHPPVSRELKGWILTPCFCCFTPGVCEPDYFTAHNPVGEAAVGAVYCTVIPALLWQP